MAIDTKEVIAQAVRTLLIDKKVKKLTVKDIVEECNITRQTFYYHFEDIPDLLKWIAGQASEKIMKECAAQGDPESGLRYFFLLALNIRPIINRGMQSNYREELEKLLISQFYSYIEEVAEKDNLYPDCSRADLKLILRYHSYAVMGILRNWNDADTENLDHIVHEIFLLLTGEIRPF